MSSSPGVRSLRRPPTDLDCIRIPRTRQPARDWFRAHQSQRAAIYYSVNANHRFSHAESRFSLLYVAADPATCLFERFGDITYDQQNTVPMSLWQAHSISTVSVPEVHVCDLTNAKTLSALKVDLSALMHHDLATPQEWGIALQRHPANFQGIRFKSRFNGKNCLALFQRDGLEKSLRDISMGTLVGNDGAISWLDKHKVHLY